MRHCVPLVANLRCHTVFAHCKQPDKDICFLFLLGAARLDSTLHCRSSCMGELCFLTEKERN